MNKYNVTITETLRMDLEVSAESKQEAIDKVEEDWENGVYILGAEQFDGVSIEAEDITPKKIIDFYQMHDLFTAVNENGLKPINGYIVFRADSFNRSYCLTSRTYCVSSRNKAFMSGQAGYSIFASCLDGTDQNVRIDGYIRGRDPWKIDYCYIAEEDYDRTVKELKSHVPVSESRDSR